MEPCRAGRPPFGAFSGALRIAEVGCITVGEVTMCCWGCEAAFGATVDGGIDEVDEGEDLA